MRLRSGKDCGRLRGVLPQFGKLLCAGSSCNLLVLCKFDEASQFL